MEIANEQPAPYVLTEQQKAYKENKECFKYQIFFRVKYQKYLKWQRKPENASVELPLSRSFAPSLAQSKHAANRVGLRHLYLAYAMFRAQYGGYKKAIPSNENCNMDVVNKLLGTYGAKTVHYNS